MLLMGVGGRKKYADRVRATAPANLILYTPLLEPTGSVGVNYGGPAPQSDRSVAYVGPTPEAIAGPFGGLAHQWDAVNDVVNDYTTSLASLWNWSAWTYLLFFRVRAASVWSDGVARKFIYYRNASFSAIIDVQKHATANQIQFNVRVAGGDNYRTYSTAAPTGWVGLALSYLESENRYRVFYSAQAFGATPAVAPVQIIEETTVGSNTGALNSDGTTLGAYSVSSPSSVCDGYICEHAVWNTELDFATQLSPLMRL